MSDFFFFEDMYLCLIWCLVVIWDIVEVGVLVIELVVLYGLDELLCDLVVFVLDVEIEFGDDVFVYFNEE